MVQGVPYGILCPPNAELRMQLDDNVLAAALCQRLLCVTLNSVAHQASLFVEFSRQEYWSG